MRKILSFSIAVLAIGAMLVVVSGNAQAEPKFSGNVAAGFGQVTYGGATEDTSELITSIESNFRFTVGDDTLRAMGRYRTRGHQSATTSGSSVSLDSGAQPRAVYGELQWKAANNLWLDFGQFQGGGRQAWSQPMVGSYKMLSPIGHNEYWMNWTGISGMDITYSLGAIKVGLAMATECRPSCGGGTGADVVASESTSTVPHAMGSFGAISFRFQMPSTAGKSDLGNDVSGTGYQLGVAYKAGGMKIGFDLQSFVDDAATSADADIETAGMGLKLTIAGIEATYHTKTNVGQGGAADTSDTTIKLAYVMKTGAGVLIPEYQTVTNDGTDLTNSLIRLVLSVGI